MKILISEAQLIILTERIGMVSGSGFDMTPEDRTGNYKFKRGDRVGVQLHNWKTGRGIVIGLTSHSVNNKDFNAYNIHIDGENTVERFPEEWVFELSDDDPDVNY